MTLLRGFLSILPVEMSDTKYWKETQIEYRKVFTKEANIKISKGWNWSYWIQNMDQTTKQQMNETRKN